jgi:hypothetical protein
VPRWKGFCHVERSRDISKFRSMPRDYNFRVICHEPELVGALYWSNESPVTANLGTPRRDQGTTKIELINRLNPRWMISALMFCEINKFERFESVTPVRSAFGPPLCRGFPRHSVLDYPSFGSK